MTESKTPGWIEGWREAEWQFYECVPSCGDPDSHLVNPFASGSDEHSGFEAARNDLKKKGV